MPVENPRRAVNNRTVHPGRAVLLVLAALVLVAAACGSDDEQSAQEKYCESGQELESSVDSLVSIDPVAAGTDGVEDALNQVLEDAESLKDNASDAAEDEVDALETAVEEAQAAIADLGGELTADNASAVVGALGAIQTAATAVYGTLADC